MVITKRELSESSKHQVDDVVKGFSEHHGIIGKIIDKKEIDNIINNKIYLYKIVLSDDKTIWCNGLYLKKISLSELKNDRNTN